ncbi:MAG: ACT domain-containing protein [Candidatus Bathyarchaeota archaeon]|nr:ACT domain-containing protein [Candidatus Bathyarchaeota archaeon]
MTQITGMRKILAETRVKEHPDDYSIVFIDPRDEEKARTLLRDLKPYSSVTYTGEEISVVLRSADWAKLKASFPGYKEEGPYRLITFDIVLDLSIVGFLSVVSTALAEAGVSIYALSTYLKDHILVKKGDAVKAVSILNGLVSEAKRG